MKKKEMEAHLKRTDIKIEESTATWELAVNGDIAGLYAGQFKFKCYLTPTEILAAGRLYRELLGPNGMLASKHEDTLAFSLSQLKYRVISAPPFWTSALGLDGSSGDIPDANVLDAILDAALASQFKYLALLKKKKEESIQRAKKAAEKMLSEQPDDNEDEDDE